MIWMPCSLSHNVCVCQGMYAVECEDLPEFRRYVEDMNYASAPSRFQFHAAYLEVNNVTNGVSFKMKRRRFARKQISCQYTNILIDISDGS